MQLVFVPIISDEFLSIHFVFMGMSIKTFTQFVSYSLMFSIFKVPFLGLQADFSTMIRAAIFPAVGC